MNKNINAGKYYIGTTEITKDEMIEIEKNNIEILNNVINGADFDELYNIQFITKI